MSSIKFFGFTKNYINRRAMIYLIIFIHKWPFIICGAKVKSLAFVVRQFRRAMFIALGLGLESLLTLVFWNVWVRAITV